MVPQWLYTMWLCCLFSSFLFFILPLVQSNYRPFCQGTAQNALSNTSNQQFPLFSPSPSPLFFLSSLVQTMAGVDRQCTAVIFTPTPLQLQRPLTPPPLTSVVSSQTWGSVVRGWTLRSKQSMQVAMTSCPPPPLPPAPTLSFLLLLSLHEVPRGLPGRMSEIWMGLCYQQAVVQPDSHHNYDSGRPWKQYMPFHTCTYQAHT